MLPSKEHRSIDVILSDPNFMANFKKFIQARKAMRLIKSVDCNRGVSGAMESLYKIIIRNPKLFHDPIHISKPISQTLINKYNQRERHVTLK